MGGGGLVLRDPADEFTGADLAATKAARDAYFSADVEALSEFQTNAALAIILNPDNSDDNEFQTYRPGQAGDYDAAQWLDRTDAVQGPKGPKGDSSGGGSATGEVSTDQVRDAAGIITVAVGICEAGGAGRVETLRADVFASLSAFVLGPTTAEKLHLYVELPAGKQLSRVLSGLGASDQTTRFTRLDDTQIWHTVNPLRRANSSTSYRFIVT